MIGEIKMTRYETLAKKFAEREIVRGTTVITLANPLLVESMNRDDLDFILFDAEHGVFDTQNVVPLLQICRLMGLPALVRAQDCEYHLIAKAIDMGADGVMIPRTETLSQLKTTVDALLFAPDGRKGCGGHAQFRKGEKFEDFPKTRFLLPQIESPAGIEALPEMLEKFGEHISAVMIGPYDLSVMLGKPKKIGDTVVLDAIQKIFDISGSYGKSCGIFCDNASLAAKYRKMGCNVLWCGSDGGFFARGYSEEMAELAAID